jgi:lysine-specific demethylase 8
MDFDLDEADLDFRQKLVKIDFPNFVFDYLDEILNKLLNSSDTIELENLDFMCHVLIDYSWEFLNTNIWVFVDDKWRLLYAYSTLYKILCIKKRDSKDLNKDKIVKLCDLGLLMSGPLLEKQFDKIIKHLNKNSNQISAKKPTSNHESLKIIDSKTLRQDCLITKESSPTIEHFKLDYFNPKIPCIIQNQMLHWPAMNKWSLEYLCELAGNRTVPVELGSKYTDSDWSQKLMTIQDFIETFIVNQADSKGYLAQHPLFDQVHF